MARLTFPDEGSRLVFRTSGAGKPLLSAAGGTATIYSNEAGTTLADIQTRDGVTVAGSVLSVNATSQLPLFLGPDGVDQLWASVDGGPLAPVYSRADDRLDTIEGQLSSVVTGAVTDATTTAKGVVQLAGDLGGTAAAPTTPTSVHLTGNESINGIKTFVITPVVPDGSFGVVKLSATGTKSATTVLHGDNVFRTVSGTAPTGGWPKSSFAADVFSGYVVRLSWNGTNYVYKDGTIATTTNRATGEVREAIGPSDARASGIVSADGFDTWIETAT